MKRKRTFWKWIEVWPRAFCIAEARKQRMRQEIRESWICDNRSFIKMRTRRRKNIYKPSADDTNIVGPFGGEFGDGMF